MVCTENTLEGDATSEDCGELELYFYKSAGGEKKTKTKKKRGLEPPQEDSLCPVLVKAHDM